MHGAFVNHGPGQVGMTDKQARARAGDQPADVVRAVREEPWTRSSTTWRSSLLSR